MQSIMPLTRKREMRGGVDETFPLLGKGLRRELRSRGLHTSTSAIVALLIAVIFAQQAIAAASGWFSRVS